MKIMVSACLCGFDCKYNGFNNQHPVFIQMHKEGQCMVICPETEGGLSVPRSPCEIIGGDGRDVIDGKARVINKNAEDMTAAFINGAEQTLNTALQNQIELVILKDRSPSCGAGGIYDGTFSGQLRSGDGVTAALLKKHAIDVISDKEYLMR
ncbi:MAG: DUF523 domain-containing protein [Syntrophomonadaceae bacterium]|nr:DUF523 domain-containing protein [Syntrophomonadaceae bacterium]